MMDLNWLIWRLHESWRSFANVFQILVVLLKKDLWKVTVLHFLEKKWVTLRLLFDRCSASNQDMRENRRTNSNRAGYNFEKEIMPTLPDPNLEIKVCVCVGRGGGGGIQGRARPSKKIVPFGPQFGIKKRRGAAHWLEMLWNNRVTTL